jgi:hypothetical protein
MNEIRFFFGPSLALRLEPTFVQFRGSVYCILVIEYQTQ